MTNANAVQDGATDHVTFVNRSPDRERVRGCRGGGVGNDFITVVTVNPSLGGFDVNELRGTSGANVSYDLAQTLSKFKAILSGRNIAVALVTASTLVSRYL